MKYLLRGLFCLSLFLLPAWSQILTEDCHRFERDGLPGQSYRDLHANLAFWTTGPTTPTNTIADYDNDRRITVLDFTRQTACLQLGPGLLAKYYGFDEGQPEPGLTLANTASVGISAAAVHVVTEIDDDGTDGTFLNSSMRRAFRAEFHGFLTIPETAEYRFQLLRGQEQRLILNGETLIETSGAPFFGEVTVQLTRGLAALHIDVVHNEGNPELIFAWASNGNIVGPNLTTVGGDFLQHNRSTPASGSGRRLEVQFSQASFSRVTTANPTLTAKLLSPATQGTMTIQGRPVPVHDGVATTRLTLQPGLNHIPWRATAGENDRAEGTLVLHYDDGQSGSPGMAAMFYPNGPDIHAHSIRSDAIPLLSTTYPTAEFGDLRGGPNDILEGRRLGRDLTTWFRGRIWIEEPGTYRFRLHSHIAAQCRINGKTLITQANRDRLNEAIFLERGYHHLEISNTERFHSPHHEFTWMGPGFGWQTIPPDLLSHRESDRIAAPDFTANQGHPSRVGGDLIAEYLFEKENLFADSGEHGYHLQGDTRVVAREEVGFTSSGAFELFSTEAGSHFGEAVKTSNAFTLEFDFVFRTAPIATRKILLLEWRPFVFKPFFHLFVVGNELRFAAYNGENRLVRFNTNERYHLVITMDQQDMRLYLNGREQETFRRAGAEVPLAFYNNTQTLRFREMFGTTNVLALYSRALSAEEVTANYQANLALRPTPNEAPAYWSVGETFEMVPAGTSDNQLAEALHVLNRAAFGPSPESLRAVLTQGVDAWLEQQLHPETIPQSELITDETLYYRPDQNGGQLQARMLFRMVHSERQLEEVMTWFWENHFSTDLTKTASPHQERLENDRFRRLAFGRFEDLLRASALNLPMTRYLDSATNVVGAPNENYAREILELHSYGEGNGYTYEDIVAAARCFTGWSERDGQFAFVPGRHDFGEKTLLGTTLPAKQGFNQGLALIRHIAASPNTAFFISTKLCQRFVADHPPADLVQACTETYLDSDGDIREVLRTLLTHPAFRNHSQYRRNKIKTPLEFWVSAQRALASRDHQGVIQNSLKLLGMDLFHFMEPTGFSERNDAWIDTNAVFYRWQIANGLTGNPTRESLPSINIDYLRHRYGLHTTDEALRYMELMFAHGRETPEVRRITEHWLTDGSMQDLPLEGNHRVHQRLPQTLNLYLRSPAFNVQ